MKILHTADWHLGRLLSGVSLIRDQEHVLLQLFDVVERERPDVVLIAGDLYDRAIPPTDAIRLFDHVIVRLIEDLKVPVIAIPGNHDSSERLAFGAALFRARGLHLATSLDVYTNPIVLHDGYGPVDFHAIPYSEPVEARLATGDEEVHSHDAAMRALLRPLQETKSGRRVLIAHAFVEGGAASESERPLSVGGAETVRADAFAGFDYVALGHLHAPQSVGADTIRYSGSICRYSFSEEKHEKSFTIIEMQKDGLEIRTIPVAQRRGMRTIEATFDELKERAAGDEAREDYLRIRLLDRAPVLDAKSRLEPYYPNILEIHRPQFEHEAGDMAMSSDHIRALTPADHFREFFRYIRDMEMTAKQAEVFAHIVDATMNEES